MTSLDELHTDIRDIREAVGAIQIALSDMNVKYEHRITKMETRASAIGAMFGVLTGVLSSIIWPHRG